MSKTYGTSGGVPITEEVIQAANAAAEEGYDADQLTPRVTWTPSGAGRAEIEQRFERHYQLHGAPRFVFQLGDAFEPRLASFCWRYGSGYFANVPDTWWAVVKISGPRVLKSCKLSAYHSDAQEWDDGYGVTQTDQLPDWLRPLFEQVRAEFEGWRDGPVNALIEATVFKAAAFADLSDPESQARAYGARAVLRDMLRIANGLSESDADDLAKHLIDTELAK